MARSKAQTFIGFSIKAGKIALGGGAIDTLKKGVYLIILNGDAAKNSLRLALKFKNRFSCPLVICKSGFEEAVNKSGCKIAAIKDKNLAQAILTNLDDSYEFYAEASD